MKKTCKSCRGRKPGYRCWFCDDEDLAAQQTPDPSGWPMASEAAAVNPKDRGAAIEAARKMGVPTYYDRAGRPVFTSAGHRAAYCRAFGYRDNNGGYGDYTGHSRTSEREAMARENVGIHPDL